MSGFEDEEYQLEGCRLVFPTRPQAEFLAEELSQIDPWKSLGTSVQLLADHFGVKEAGSSQFAVFVDENPMGFISVKRRWLLGPYLEFVGLLPSVQGKGLGKVLLRWFEEQAGISKARNLFLCVTCFNHGAIRFYEDAGFEKCAELEGLIQDGTSELLMRKRLF